MANLRLLVVDSSPLAAWVVARLVPDGVRVITATSLRQAKGLLATDPPDGVIINLNPCHLGWRDLVELCARRHPPIPFRCSSALDETEWHHDEMPFPREDRFVKTIPVDELKRVVLELVAEAERLPSNGDTRVHV